MFNQDTLNSFKVVQVGGCYSLASLAMGAVRELVYSEVQCLVSPQMHTVTCRGCWLSLSLGRPQVQCEWGKKGKGVGEKMRWRG